MKKIFPFLVLLLLSGYLHAQPYIDLLQANGQWMSTKYRHNSNGNISGNTFLNLFLPKKLRNDRVVFVRFNFEMLYSSISGDTSYHHTVYGMTLPIGYQSPLGKSRFSLLYMVMPKISSDLREALGKEDLQLGGVALLTWKKNDRLKVKAGLFYNRECFGNFFVPLLGVDWKVSDKFQLYGLLPQLYRAEYRVSKKLFAGLGFRFYGRSYRLNSNLNHDYIWNQENQVKLFVDYHIRPRWVIYGEVSRSLGFGPYRVARRDEKNHPAFTSPLYSALQDGFFVNVGSAFRLRSDY